MVERNPDLRGKPFLKNGRGGYHHLIRSVSNVDRKVDRTHSYYERMLVEINDLNTIKYAAYRTASKLLVVQKRLSLNVVRLGIIAGVFERHHMSAASNSASLKSSELEDIVSDIMFAASRERNHGMKLIDDDSFSMLITKFLLKVFDKENKKSVNVFDAKVALVILSSSRLQDKLCYLFSILADKNYLLSREKFQLLLYSLVSITNYLSESNAFSSLLVPSTVETFFAENFHHITEKQFLEWFLTEPPLLIWLPTFYRLRAASNVRHNVYCHVCKTDPIVGLRYKCLRCLNYDQCQNCFFSARVTKKHRVTHPMQEFCWQTSSRETTLLFLKTVINKLCRRHPKLQYLPAQPSDALSYGKKRCENVISEPAVESNFEDCVTDIGSQLNMSKNPQQELQDIISQLEQVNRCLEDEMGSLCADGKVCKYLTEHKQLVESQIQKLNSIKDYLQKLTFHRKPRRFASTPIVNKNKNDRLQTCELSPIQDKTGEENSSTPDQTKELHFESISENVISSWLVSDLESICRTNENFSDWLKPNKINFSCDENLLKANTVCSTSLLSRHEQANGNIDKRIGKMSRQNGSPLSDVSNRIGRLDIKKHSNSGAKFNQNDQEEVGKENGKSSLDDSRVSDFSEIRSQGIRKPIRKQMSLNKLYKNDPNKIVIKVNRGTPQPLKSTVDSDTSPDDSEEIEKINRMLSELDDILIKLSDVIPSCE